MDIQRDLRSAHRDFKRDKDAHTKWAMGIRAPGCLTDLGAQGMDQAMDKTQEVKFRPQGKASDTPHPKKRNHNIVKSRGNYQLPHSRVREAIRIMEETKDLASSTSEVDVLHSPKSGGARANSVHSEFGTSSDRLNRSLPLDTFVKLDERATERLVAKEYQILDMSGRILKGRKARGSLRCSQSAQLVDDDDDDDGFELI